MRYDFTKIIDRHGKDAIAVDGLGKNPGFAPEPPKDGFDVIPMWVADMNFPTVPTMENNTLFSGTRLTFSFPCSDRYSAVSRI